VRRSQGKKLRLRSGKTPRDAVCNSSTA
jgi:hypothetical protein